MLCCTDTYDIGCFGRCDNISTGITAAATGTYQIIYQIANGVVRQNVDYTIGEEIIFSPIFNEDYITVFSILDPARAYVTFNDFSCFQVTIR